MKRWFKRGSCFLLALLLSLQLTAMPSRAAQTVYFTAANDRVMDLNDATMPFMQNGMYYLSQNIFNNSPLDIYFSRNKANNTVSLYTAGIYLTFYLDDNTVSDSQGNSYNYRLIVKGDTVFFPMNLLTGYFGLTYTVLQTEHAPLIRIRSGSDNLSDQIFLDAAKNMLSVYYNRYLKAKAEENASRPPQSTDTPAKGLYPICPVVTVSDIEGCRTVLEQLNSRKWSGLFLFQPEEIGQYGDLIRCIVAGGHSVGFVGLDFSLQQLQQANELLFLAAGRKSRAVLDLNGDEESRRQLQAAGYSPLLPAGDYSNATLKNSTESNKLLQAHRRQQPSVLFLGTSRHLGASAGTFFARLQSNSYYCVAWRESY